VPGEGAEMDEMVPGSRPVGKARPVLRR
jgi:hypothetical protein